MGLAIRQLQAFVVILCVGVGVCFTLNSLKSSYLYADHQTALQNTKRCSRRAETVLFSSSNNDRNNKLKASELEQREEAKRKRERANDVVIGKTSAKPDAKDYGLDPKATENEFLRQATNVEQEIYVQTEKGLEHLKMLSLQEAVSAFDRVFELKPNAYVWQAGIAKFYLGDLEGAADIFARSACIYESKFLEPASEERIWRHACELKLLNSMSKKERKLLEETGGAGSLLAPIPEQERTVSLLGTEIRKVIRITRDLFSASVERDHSARILSRAKLRSIGGTFDERPKMDLKMWKLNSWYYLGLHYDCLGEPEESKKCMKMALQLCPSAGNGGDIVHTLPMLHMSQRDWFDDDDFESGPNNALESEKFISTALEEAAKPLLEGEKGMDPIFVESIKSSLSEMSFIELQEALGLRGLRSSGSKEQVLVRLFLSLIEDANLYP